MRQINYTFKEQRHYCGSAGDKIYEHFDVSIDLEELQYDELCKLKEFIEKLCRG